MNKKIREFCKKKSEDNGYYNRITYKYLTVPITILLGPNGTGKSTSIRGIVEELKKNKKKYIQYSTSNNDIVKRASNPFDYKPEYLISAFHSEGERMDDSIYFWMSETLVRACLEDKKDLYIFIDEIDSGTSIDKMYQQLDDLMFIFNSEQKKNRNINLILTANSFELVDYFLEYPEDLVQYIWLPSKERVRLNSYNKFKEKYLEYFKEMKSYGEKDN